MASDGPRAAAASTDSHWYDTAPFPTVNLARSVFGAELNHAGITHPVINGMVVCQNPDSTQWTDEIRLALNPPQVSRGGAGPQSVRVESIPRNRATAVANVPSAGPWSTGSMEMSRIATFAGGDGHSPAVVRSVLEQMPPDGAVRVVITPAGGFVATTIAHELRHVADIRAAFIRILARWDEAMASVLGAWFPSPAQLWREVWPAEEQSESTDVTRRVAEELSLAFALDARFFHTVEAADLLFSEARWDAAARTLYLTVQDVEPTLR